MPPEASVFQRTQIGKETTAGTGVACSKRFPSLMITSTPMADIKMYRPQGSKVDAVAAINKEWAALKFDGNGTYNELPYLLASILTNQGIGGSGVWTFQPSVFSPDVAQTYTVQHGSDTYATQIVNGLATDITLSATRDEFKTSGSGIGKLESEGITFTSNPTMIGKVPVTASQISVFADSSLGALGNTQLTKIYSWELSIANRYGPDWTLDNTQTSWADSVELVPNISLKMKLMRNAVNTTILTRMRANATTYMQFNSQGPSGYSISCSMPIAVQSLGEPEDLAGVYVVEWTFKPIQDDGFMTANNGAWMNATVINTLSAL